MESLYTKYRPQTFEQVVGQSHVVETLKRAVLEGRTSHAYLFCGPRGTGKTTIGAPARQGASCASAGQAGLPDGTCAQCSSRSRPGVRTRTSIELDAASRTGVDNVREEIICRVSYAPTRGRCKVYIIDEVHMLTDGGVQRAAQDARGAPRARGLHHVHHRPPEDPRHHPLPRAAL